MTALRSATLCLLLLSAPAAAQTEVPTIGQRVATMAPRTTRAGFLRFTGDFLREPGAGAAVVDRIEAAGDSSEVRVALAESLQRAQDVPWPRVARLAIDDADPSVRAMVLRSLREAAAEIVAPALRAAAESPVTNLRRAAAAEIYWRRDRDVFGDLAVRLAEDSDATVRRDIVRAAGLAPEWSPSIPIRLLLSDPSAEVRLAALRSAERAAPELLDAVSLDRLAADPDSRIAAAARMLVRR